MNSASTASLALRMVFSLGVVIVLMVLAARVMRKRGLVGKTGKKSVDVLVLGRRGLGKHASVTVIEAAGRRLIVGVTDQRVTLLADATDSSGIDPVLDLEIERDLIELERHGTALPAGPSTPMDSASARKGLLDSLRDMTVRRV